MVKMKGSYTRYKDKKTKKKSLRKLHAEKAPEDPDVMDDNQAGDVEHKEEEAPADPTSLKGHSIGKTKLIYKQKEKKTREYIKALMAKRSKGLSKRDLHQKEK